MPSWWVRISARDGTSMRTGLVELIKQRRSRPTWRNYQDCRDQILNRRQPNCVGFITPRFVLSSVAFFDLRSAYDYRTFRRNPVTLFPGERASSEAIAMPTTEYYQKQIELLLLWASAATSRDLQVKLIERACQLLVLANCADYHTLSQLASAHFSAETLSFSLRATSCR